MNDLSLHRLDLLLGEALDQLLQSHDLVAEGEGRDSAAPSGDFSAAIGFTGAKLGGALILTLERASLLRSLPPNLRNSAPAEALLADWCGELANQLLGRLKNGLWVSGLEIALGTPVTFVAEELAHFCPRPRVQRSLERRLATGRALVELELDCEEGLELEEAGPSSSGLGEGEFSLF